MVFSPEFQLLIVFVQGFTATPNSELGIINYQLSIINYQLSITMFL
ncbi:hypothetical protein [Sphaerospermopsis aphanizomenoides]|nr:hypothetical protein [Sphaerospermopsis aphanizomenoides]